MALVPGLTPFREDQPQAGTRAPRNVPFEAPRIDTPGLRPQAAPVETYSRPAMPQADPLLDGIADSLSALNPALARFGSVARAKEEDTADAYARAKAVEAGSPEAFAAIADTDPRLKTDLGKAAAQRVSGMQNSTLALETIQSAYVNEFDKVNGDFDAFVAEKVKPYLGERANDPSYVKSFMDSLDPGLRQIRAGYAGYKANEQHAANQQTFSDAFLSIARNGDAQGVPAADQAKAIFAEFYGNQKLIGMGYQDQAKAVAALATKLAEEGNYDLVSALANTDRTGPDGKPMGKLLDDNIVGGEMAKSILRAKAIRDDKNQEAGIDTRQSLFDKFTQGQATDEDEAAIRQLVKDKPGLVSEAWANGMIAQNRNERERVRDAAAKEAAKVALDAQYANQQANLENTGIEAIKTGRLGSLADHIVIDKEGNETTLSGEDYRKLALEAFRKRSMATAVKNGETWDQTVLRELPFYSKIGIPPKDWKDIMVAGANSLSSAVAVSGEIPEAAQRGYALYKLLRTNKSQLLRDLIPQDRAELFETWRISEELLGMDPKKAMVDAIDLNANPTGRPNRAAQINMEKVRKATETGSLLNSIKGVFGGGIETLNGSMLADAVAQRAEVLAGRGLDAETAIAQAAEQVQLSHVNVNGWWIDASDKRLPPNFADLSTELIREYVEKHGAAEGVGVDDLTIYTPGQGGSAWRIVSKTTRAPVDNAADSVFTSDDLMVADENRKAEIDRMRAENAAAAARKAYEPWLQLGNPDGPAEIHLGPFLPTKWKDPAVQEKLREGRRNKAEKQSAAIEALGTGIVEGAKAVGEATRKGASDAVAPMLEAISERRAGQKRESARWRAERQKGDNKADDALPSDEDIAANQADIRRLQHQLDEARKGLIPQALKMLEAGVPRDRVTAFLRKNGIKEDIWPADQ